MSNLSFGTRVEELYRILSETEKRDLGRYLQSPYFNRDSSLATMHLFITSALNGDVSYDRKTAWKFIYPKAAYNEKRFYYIVSDLVVAIEEFIYANQILKDKPQYIHVVNEYYTLRGAEESKAWLGRKIKGGKTARSYVISPQHYLEQHFNAELMEELHSGSLKEYSKYVAQNPKHQPGGLDTYYVIEKLRQMCLAANDNNVFGTNTKCFFEKETLQLAQAPVMANNEFIQAYTAVYALLTAKSEPHYFTLKKIIAGQGYRFEDQNLAELFGYARNFCIARINSGNGKFYSELFDLYEQGLQKRVLLVNGEINERNYKNIVTTALRIKRYEWVEGFIEEYKPMLNKVVRENAFHYNLANYYFHTGKFDKALLSLQKVELADLFYGLDARALMLKCYYELDEKEAFLNHYYSFRMFIQRRKNVSEQHRNNYNNLLRISKKLINLRPRDKKAIAGIAQQIESARGLADKNWLQEKLKVYQ